MKLNINFVEMHLSNVIFSEVKKFRNSYHRTPLKSKAKTSELQLTSHQLPKNEYKALKKGT